MATASASTASFMISGVWLSIVDSLLPLCGGNERVFFMVIVFFAVNTPYLLGSFVYGLFEAFDLFPERRVKRPSGMKPASPELVRKAWLNAIVIAITSPISAAIAYDFYKWRGMDMTAPFPDLWTSIAHLLVAVVTEDTLFYWAHRGLHHPRIYKYIHKQHHEFHASKGIAAMYAHPVEEFLANFLPTFSGAFISGAPLCILAVWVAVRVWETVEAHSGFEFAWSPFNLCLTVQGGAERHDFHHSRNKGAYGSLTKFWDWACGTDVAYNEWRKAQQESEASKAETSKSK
eukprot:m.101957 g.101957  ORF g.101957 m.101957 type:complete len:289 (-) comp14995_c2_seq1:950-1816(-)